MNKKISSAHRIAFVLLVLVTLGCGASTQAVATEPIESVATEVVATDAPAEAPASLPDMSIARIFRQQLPGGFEEIPTDDFFEEATASVEEEYLPEVVFAYINRDEFQVILGMNYLLVDGFTRLGFNAALNDPDSLKELAGAMGGENIREEETLKNLDTLGEKRSAITMLADVEGIPMRVNAAMFQRGIIGGMIISMTMEGEASKISFEELTKRFDQRVQESLESAE